MDGSDSPDERDHARLLAELDTLHPRLASVLRKAAATRERELRQYLHGARLRGLAEYLTYLDGVEDRFRSTDALKKVAPLIARAKADFEVAFEASLSGLVSFALDAMRDTLEIEYLLLDFTSRPANIDAWLTSSERERMRRFQPRVLRDRLSADSPGLEFRFTNDLDYKGHSMALHVSPIRLPFSGRGLRTDHTEIDLCFWEIFEHARRIAVASEDLEIALVPARKPEQELDDRLPAFKDGWKRTQEMQHIIVAMMNATMQEARKRNSDNTE